MTTPDSTTGPGPDDSGDAAPADPREADNPTEGRDQNSGNKEAARYRRQLRDTETERDTLRERVTGYERAAAERLAAETLTDPADMWAAGVQLDDLRGEDGTLDPEKVSAAITGIVAQRPHWARPANPRPDRRQGGGQHDPVDRRSWADALRNRR